MDTPVTLTWEEALGGGGRTGGRPQHRASGPDWVAMATSGPDLQRAAYDRLVATPVRPDGLPPHLVVCHDSCPPLSGELPALCRAFDLV